MNFAASARKRARAWVDADDDSGALARFRATYFAIWLVYDTLDVAMGYTERARDWFPHPRSIELVALQLGLVASGLLMLATRRVYFYGMMSTALRLMVALIFFRLNDFLFCAVVTLLLAHSDGGPFGSDRKPKWVRDVLLVQLGWVYFATALLKANPDWLSGGHLFVRTEYLARGLGWPYPPFLRAAFASLPVDAALAKLAIGSELLLAGVLWARRPYWLGVALVIGIHTFGTLVTNVWFFSAQTIAAVVLLLPRGRPPTVASGS